jgi:membrane-associated phospholipid phosphatase
MFRRRVLGSVCLSATLVVTNATAAGGPFLIDHSVKYDDTGIWHRRNQVGLEYGAALTVLAGALWEGNDSRLGHTHWQAVDSLVLGSISAQALKLAFSRARPSQTNNPNDWFQGRGHKSFPSGEVTEIASAVTPYVLEYGHEYPAVYALELLPLYDAVARVKVQAHWQSDVLAGFAIGTAAGYYAHTRSTPISVQLLPHGITVGWHRVF